MMPIERKTFFKICTTCEENYEEFGDALTEKNKKENKRTGCIICEGLVTTAHAQQIAAVLESIMVWMEKHQDHFTEHNIRPPCFDTDKRLLWEKREEILKQYREDNYREDHASR